MEIFSASIRSYSAAASKLLVWIAWGAMTLAALWYVATYASPVPRHDFWDIVPQVAGGAPLTGQWLWQPHNEHRIPLPKLTIVALSRAASDIRASSYLSVLLASAAAAAFVWQSQRLRGGASLSDAVYPLLFLHLAHYTTFLWPFQVMMVQPMTLLAAMTIVMAGTGTDAAALQNAADDSRPTMRGGALSWGMLLVFGMSLVAAPLCGMAGVLCVLPCSVWAVAVAGRGFAQPGQARRKAIVLIAFVALGVGVASIALAQQLVRPSSPASIAADAGAHANANVAAGPKNSRLTAVARTGLQCLAVSVGAGINMGDAFGITWERIAPALLLAVTASLVILFRTWRRDALSRPRAEGLLAAIAGLLLLIAGIAFGRAGQGADAGLQDRYAFLTAPLVATCCLAAAMDRGWTGRAVAWGLFLLVLAAAPLNVQFGLAQGQFNHVVLDPVEQQLRQGIPAAAVSFLQRGALWPGPESELTTRIAMLQRAGMLPAGRLPADQVAPMLNAWGVELAKAGRFAEAEQRLQESLAADPHFEAAATNLATVHAALRRAGEKAPSSAGGRSDALTP